MENKEFIDIINKYQNNDNVHELTCICGEILNPVEKNEVVILRCKICGWEQEMDDFLKSMVIEMYDYDPFGLKVEK